MRIQYVSDLHIDENIKFDITARLANTDNADVLLICGDTAHGYFYGIDKIPMDILNRNEIIAKVKLMEEWQRTHWKHVVTCFGNHDFYYHNLPADYVGHVETINNIDFICTPLFSNMSEGELIRESIKPMDYRFIDMRYIKNISSKSYVNYHKKCLAWLDEQLNKTTAAVVATHHLPSMVCIDEQYKDSGINYFFASDLDDFIEKHSNKIIKWVCGHSHSARTLNIGGVEILRSPIGYLNYGECRSYKTSYFDIDTAQYK